MISHKGHKGDGQMIEDGGLTMASTCAKAAADQTVTPPPGSQQRMVRCQHRHLHIKFAA